LLEYHRKGKTMPATTGAIEIATYEVGTNREVNSANPFERFIYMRPKHPTSTVKHLVVYFYANSVEVNDPDIGYQTPATDYWVVGLAPVADFDDMYKILLTEKPVYLQWAAGNNDKLFWFQVSSRNEPIGHN
jgi:hypothetical protein